MKLRTGNGTIVAKALKVTLYMRFGPRTGKLIKNNQAQQ
jgi:hypothetical protein